VGGVGSLKGAFGASMMLGVMQTGAVAWDVILIPMQKEAGHWWVGEFLKPLEGLKLSQLAPLLPYLLLLLILSFYPNGIWGRRKL
jgi:branched-chain amino acid transport system permease protein